MLTVAHALMQIDRLEFIMQRALGVESERSRRLVSGRRADSLKISEAFEYILQHACCIYHRVEARSFENALFRMIRPVAATLAHTWSFSVSRGSLGSGANEESIETNRRYQSVRAQKRSCSFCIQTTWFIQRNSMAPAVRGPSGRASTLKDEYRGGRFVSGEKQRTEQEGSIGET